MKISGGRDVASGMIPYNKSNDKPNPEQQIRYDIGREDDASYSIYSDLDKFERDINMQ